MLLPANSQPCDRRLGRPPTRMTRSEVRRMPWPSRIPNRRLLLYPCLFYFAPSGAAKRRRGPGLMPNTRKILIVDDDAELRDALTEQLSLHEEFEAEAVENGSKGVQAAKTGTDRSRHHGCRPARHRRPRSRAHPAQERLQGADHHAHRPRHRFRHHPRPRIGRQRLRHQAVPLRRAAGAHPRAAAPARGERGRRLHHRPIHVPAKLEALAQSQGQQGPPDREGNVDPALPLSRRPAAGVARDAACRRSGATIPASPRTRSKPTSIDCGRRSRRMLPLPPSWSPKPAATNWCRNRG